MASSELKRGGPGCPNLHVSIARHCSNRHSAGTARRLRTDLPARAKRQRRNSPAQPPTRLGFFLVSRWHV